VAGLIFRRLSITTLGVSFKTQMALENEGNLVHAFSSPVRSPSEKS
jgi:hypothetical protein